MPPSLLTAVGLGLRATFREPWLLAVGLVVGLARRAAVWPALLVAATLLVLLVTAAWRAGTVRTTPGGAARGTPARWPPRPAA